MSDVFLLSESQMKRIEPFFPLAHGVPRVDDRRVLSGIVYVIRNGLQWKDAPKAYGPHKPGLDGAPTRRDYTPRRYDPQNGNLILDFVNHHGGPRGSQMISGVIDHWLLVGDETALPAIGRRVEELHAGASVTTVIAVPGAEDEQVFVTDARHVGHWVHRSMDMADDAAAILDVLKNIQIPERTFVWVGAEAQVAKAIRQ